MSSALATPAPTAAPAKVHRTTLTQKQVLDYFWAASRVRADRLDLLLQLSVVAVPTPPGWRAADVRRAFVTRRHTSDGCFTCFRRDRRVAWHHIIWIDHGGDNGIWNQVELCHVCHKRIHPWLEDERDLSAWTTPGDLALALVTDRLQLKPERRQVRDDDGHWGPGRSGRGTVLDRDEHALYKRGEWE